MPEYTVRQGDSIASIAYQHGFHWETIWNHPNNAELKQRRKDPNILHPGDVVFIPEKAEKQESASTGQRHRFRVKGAPQSLRMRLLDNDDEPRSGVSYILEIDGNLIRENRQKLGLSVGKVAEMMGISRRTLYGYERGMAKASVSTAYKLEWVLGVPLAQFVDVFQSASEGGGFFAAAKRMIINRRFLQTVFSKFTQFNFGVVHTKRAPFDFIAQCSQKKSKIICGVADKKERNVDQRTEEILSVSKIINAHPVFITEGEKTPNSNIIVIVV